MSTRRVGFMRGIGLATFAVAAVLASAPRAVADEHLTGVITVRGDTTFTLMQENASPVIVAFDDSTKIRQGGKVMPASDLIPGLRCKVAGEYDSEGRLVARRVSFSEEELEIARAINGGLTPTNQRVAENAANIQKHGVVLDEHGQTLSSHGQTLQQHGQEIVANDLKMVATTGAITTRVNNLDEFNAVDKFIVYFKNGRSDVSKEFATQLQEFAQKAKGVDGYIVQVQGYASAVGPRAFNQTLSANRAEAVTAVLAQSGIPPTNLVVPAAMGISEQVAENKTAKGQAENRRVVVTILQSKGLVHP